MLLKEHFPCDVELKKTESLCIEDIRQIYEKIENDNSRDIFVNRLLYSLTGDYGYISKMVLGTETGKQLDQQIEGQVFIYGAGQRGEMLVEGFPHKQWQGFIDANKEGSFERYPIYRLCDFEYRVDTTIVISNKYGYDEIKDMLVRDKKVPENKIIVFERLCRQASKNRYFEPECLKKYSMQNRVFMDLGCFDGIDSLRAIDFFTNDKLSICALEPDRDSCIKCMEVLQHYDKIVLMNRGIGRKREKRYFVEGGEGARFSDKGDVLAEIDTIDHIAGGNEIGFIKMDIEGYEEEALLGGAETIKRCKPVLAVCIYHKRTDVWRLPKIILEMNPEYRFHLGHYSLCWGDTVLYAVDPGGIYE